MWYNNNLPLDKRGGRQPTFKAIKHNNSILYQGDVLEKQTRTLFEFIKKLMI